MKKFVLALATLGLPYAMIAQTISPFVIAPTGGYASGNGIEFSYTVGEMTMVQTFSGGGYYLTQGFQQPVQTHATAINELTVNETAAMVVYPNPAVDNLYFNFHFPEPGKVSATLYNDLGQKVSGMYEAHYDNENMIGQTNVSQLAGGVYLLMLSLQPDNGEKTTVLIKKISVAN